MNLLDTQNYRYKLHAIVRHYKVNKNKLTLCKWGRYLYTGNNNNNNIHLLQHKSALIYTLNWVLT